MVKTTTYKIHNKTTNRWYSVKDYNHALILLKKLRSACMVCELIVVEPKEKISPNQIPLI